MNTNAALAQLSEQQLLRRFTDLVAYDRANTAQLLAHIGEIDARKLWAKHAYPSMFAFCMQRFHMSESMTGKRIWAARTARRFPVILSMVAQGELHLSGINQLGKHLTEDNHLELLARARHKSSRAIDLLVAEIAPRPDVPSRVRALPRAARFVAAAQAVSPQGARDALGSQATKEQSASEPDAVASGAAAPECAHETMKPDLPTAETAAPVSKPIAPHKQIVPLAPQRFKLEITVDRSTHDRLRVLQDLLRHTFPTADPALIVGRAIELLLDETLKKKAAVSAAIQPKPRPARRPGTKRTRAIPARVRREVWKRDLGRCTFVDEQGRRCRTTSCIEFHHEIPYGKGGRHETGNIALRCRAHNQYQADLDFGREFMAGRRRSGGAVR